MLTKRRVLSCALCAHTYRDSVRASVGRLTITMAHDACRAPLQRHVPVVLAPPSIGDMVQVVGELSTLICALDAQGSQGMRSGKAGFDQSINLLRQLAPFAKEMCWTIGRRLATLYELNSPADARVDSLAPSLLRLVSLDMDTLNMSAPIINFAVLRKKRLSALRVLYTCLHLLCWLASHRIGDERPESSQPSAGVLLPVPAEPPPTSEAAAAAAIGTAIKV